MRISILSLFLLPLTTLANPSPTPTTEPFTTDIPQSIPDKQPVAEAHLLPRQGVGAAGGPVGPAPSVTQMSPISTYMVRGPNGDKIAMPYTQLFSKVPDQWPSPTAGTIGLGTIQGVIGVVKTQSKRDLGSLPTEVAQVAEKVRVLSEGLRRRKRDVNAGERIKIEKWGVWGVAGVLGAMVVL